MSDPQVAATLAALAALPVDRQLELLARELRGRLHTPADREEMRALLVAMPEAERERHLDAMAKLLALDAVRAAGRAK